ncbi:MAG: sensor histidine kinase [Tyzzerella sp.]|nr:sensor histidine kinase [Tyzzerella sp.]
MLSIPRIIEVVLYALANFVPYLVLSVYAFSNRLRFSKQFTAFLCSIAMLVQILTRFYSIYSGIGSTSLIALIRFISYLIIFAIALNAHFGKVLFILFIYSNFSNLISIAAVCIESQFLLGQVHRLYCWHGALTMLILHLFVTLPFSITVKRRLKPMIESNPVGNEWSYFWLIPATFYLIWQYHVYGNSQNTMEVITQPRNVIFLGVVNLGAFLVYYIVIQLNSILMKNLELERQNRYLDIEKLEYQALHDRMEETRRARHDLRHHILTMSDYLETKEYDRLKAYLDSYQKSMPDNQSYLFCQNRSVNRLLLFFATQARDNNIDFQVKLSIPEELNIPESDISVILGNLLENALEACVEQQKGKRKIIISGKGDKNSLVFTIDNTCENGIKKTRNGEFLTTKPNGSGIGLQSVKHIVGRYNGVFSAEKKGEMFYVSFMLNL